MFSPNPEARRRDGRAVPRSIGRPPARPDAIGDLRALVAFFSKRYVPSNFLRTVVSFRAAVLASSWVTKKEFLLVLDL